MSSNHQSGEFDIPSDLGEARRVQNTIEEALRACRYTEHDVFSIRLALEEALVNAIKHGNQMDPDKRVRGQYRVTPDSAQPVRLAERGHELHELEESFKSWNAHVEDDGRVVPDIARV